MIIGLAQGLMVGIHLLITKAVGVVFTPPAYTFAYLCIANLLICCSIVMAGRSKELRINRTQLGRLLFVGVVNTGIQLLTVLGVNLSSATGAGVLVRTDILFGLFLGYVLYGERVHVSDVFGAGLMIWGVVWVMNVLPGALLGELRGDLYLVGAGLLIAINGFVIRFGLSGVPGRTLAFYNTLIAGSATLVYIVVANHSISTVHFTFTAIPGILAAGLSYGLSLITYYAVLEHYPVWLARAFVLVSPVVAAVGGWWLLAERLTLTQLLGGLLVVVGMVAMLVGRWEREFSPVGITAL